MERSFLITSFIIYSTSNGRRQCFVCWIWLPSQNCSASAHLWWQQRKNSEKQQQKSREKNEICFKSSVNCVVLVPSSSGIVCVGGEGGGDESSNSKISSITISVRICMSLRWYHTGSCQKYIINASIMLLCMCILSGRRLLPSASLRFAHTMFAYSLHNSMSRWNFHSAWRHS